MFDRVLDKLNHIVDMGENIETVSIAA